MTRNVVRNKLFEDSLQKSVKWLCEQKYKNFSENMYHLMRTTSVLTSGLIDECGCHGDR